MSSLVWPSPAVVRRKRGPGGNCSVLRPDWPQTSRLSGSPGGAKSERALNNPSSVSLSVFQLESKFRRWDCFYSGGVWLGLAGAS